MFVARFSFFQNMLSIERVYMNIWTHNRYL